MYIYICVCVYIYIYIYKCKCLLQTDNLQFYTTNWFKIFREYFIRIQECFYILLSKNITIIKKIFLISRFSPTKAERENITSVSKNFTRDLFFLLSHFSFFF